MSYLNHLKELASNSRKNSYIDQMCSVPSYICHNLDCVPLSRTFSFSGPEGPELYAIMLISLAQLFHSNNISFLSAPWTQQTSDHGTLAVIDSFSSYTSPMQELSTVPVSFPAPRFYSDEIFSDRHSLVTLWRQQPYCLFSISSPMLVFFIVLTAI